jgi:uncharacterized BrkB/YihY/UPF0761 family membrane protein
MTLPSCINELWQVMTHRLAVDPWYIRLSIAMLMVIGVILFISVSGRTLGC